MNAQIMVVEDDAVTRMTLVHVLRQAGYQVTEAADGETAIELLEQNTFAVVVTDIAMGLVDGMEVLHAARRQPYLPEVIVLTGHGSFDTAVLAVKEDAFDYLVKPATREMLVDCVERALDRHLTTSHLRTAARHLATAFAPEQQRPAGAASEPAEQAVPRDHEPFFAAIGALSIGATRRDILFVGRPILLTPIEYIVLRYLAERPNQLCLSRDIVTVSHEIVVDDDTEAQTLIKPHIHNLRKKLAPEYFVTERGTGYRLVNPADPPEP